MDPILKQQITDKLTKYLNRAPTENEIMNAQKDIVIMHSILADNTTNSIQRLPGGSTFVELGQILP